MKRRVLYTKEKGAHSEKCLIVCEKRVGERWKNRGNNSVQVVKLEKKIYFIFEKKGGMLLPLKVPCRICQYKLTPQKKKKKKKKVARQFIPGQHSSVQCLNFLYE